MRPLASTSRSPSLSTFSTVPTLPHSPLRLTLLPFLSLLFLLLVRPVASSPVRVSPDTSDSGSVDITQPSLPLHNVNTDTDAIDPIGAFGSRSTGSPAQVVMTPEPAPTPTDTQGWLARWLSLGGEGTVTVLLGETNLSLPHRPAAFPSHFDPYFALPVSGKLVHFALLSPHYHPSDPSHPSHLSNPTAPSSSPAPPASEAVSDLRPTWPPSFACDPLPRIPYPPLAITTVALIERGGCDFATKVRNARVRGARAVIVGDGVARDGETDEEGMKRETLITMFSPEDTLGIDIPSVFVSRASYLVLRDMLNNHTHSGTNTGLWVDISEGIDEGNALSSLLSFALLMPTLILLVTIGIHRLRVARQREADRAPPLVVLSLPERIWTPDIVWEKEDDSDDSSNGDKDATTPTNATGRSKSKSKSKDKSTSPSSATRDVNPASGAATGSQTGTLLHPLNPSLPLPPPISPAEVRTPPPTLTQLAEDDAAREAVAPSSTTPPTAPAQPVTGIDGPSLTAPVASTSQKKKRTRSSGKRYFSKDECAICMDSFKRGEIVRILPCGHVFHKDECDEWLLKWRKLCPTCRADVTVPNTDMSSSTVLTPLGPIPGPAAAGAAGPGVGGDAVRAGAGGMGNWRERFSRTVQAFREAVVGVGVDGATVDERTPLVRHDAQTPVRGRQLEGSV